MLDVGTAIGPYRVVRLLGRGGMAEVYEVDNERLGARFALKAFTRNQVSQAKTRIGRMVSAIEAELGA